jgi:hypothetical protein
MTRSTALTVGVFVAGLAIAAPGPNKDRLVVLDVPPAPAPIPALKYQLLPQVGELKPGNAAAAYLKCFADDPTFPFDEEAMEAREKLLSGPLTDIPPGSLRGYGGRTLRQADFAARLEYADWNILPQVRAEGYQLRLPEAQSLRALGSALAVRCRGQIVDKDYEGAIQTLQTIFALARHMGDCPSIITGQVGAGVAGVGLDRVEELIQQAGAPNLYWALTGLPAPLVEVRKGVSTNRGITPATFGHLLDASRVWTPGDVEAVAKRWMRTGAMTDGSEADRQATTNWLRERARDEAWLAAARQGLIAAGDPADKVGQYPPEQVLLYHVYRKSRVNYDEAFKWMSVPYWQSERPLAEMAKAPADVEDRLTRMMPFAVAKIKASHVRLEQRIALVRVVEAIRLSAGGNGGKLPTALTELAVPLPDDPVTGQPFAYKLERMTATLDGKPTRTAAGAMLQYRYVIRLRK